MKAITFLLVLTATAMFGCASLPPLPAENASVAHGPPCSYNRDLGCLEVAKSASTPRYTYQGRTYYFCSERCREEFVHNPGKFLPR